MKLPRILVGLLIAVSLLGGCSGDQPPIAIDQSTPESTILSYFWAINAERIDQALSLLTPEFQAEQSADGSWIDDPPDLENISILGVMREQIGRVDPRLRAYPEIMRVLVQFEADGERYSGGYGFLVGRKQKGDGQPWFVTAAGWP